MDYFCFTWKIEMVISFPLSSCFNQEQSSLFEKTSGLSSIFSDETITSINVRKIKPELQRILIFVGRFPEFSFKTFRNQVQQKTAHLTVFLKLYKAGSTTHLQWISCVGWKLLKYRNIELVWYLRSCQVFKSARIELYTMYLIFKKLSKCSIHQYGKLIINIRMKPRFMKFLKVSSWS